MLSIAVAVALIAAMVQAEEYTVSGVVRDKKGTTIQGVTVEVQEFGEPPPIGFLLPVVVESTTTNISGSYSLTVNETGGYKYDLVFKKQGYQTRRFENFLSTAESFTDQDATLNLLPIIDINGPYQGPVGEPISFTSEGTFDPDGDEVTYLWSFGDGHTESAANPTHSYSVTETYIVILTVEDSEGARSSSNTTCLIGDPLPVVEINGPYVREKNEPVQFSSHGSHDPDGKQITYKWDFGDDGTSDEENPAHIYTEVGIYHVKLEVTNIKGVSTSTITRCKITGDPPVCEINGPYQGTVEEGIVFSSHGSLAAGRASIIVYGWDFGDGITSSEENPRHNYSEPGVYTVILNVTDDLGQIEVTYTSCTVETQVEQGDEGEGSRFPIPGFLGTSLVLGVITAAVLLIILRRE